MINNNFFERVYEVVRGIPKGKVATYGQIASRIGTSDARRIGHALHANKDNNDVPCHRVVFKDGSLSPAFAFGGALVQKKLLENEGVEFEGDKVKLKSALI